MPHKLSNDLIKYASQLASFQRAVVGLQGMIVFFDEIRKMLISVEQLKQSIALRDVAFCSNPTEMLNARIRNIRELGPTCDLCCHYQAHPPRCVLCKRPISPKQFSCKKYSPKYNTKR